MQNANSKKTFPGAGRFDSINSTYKHEIFLKNGKILTGYSKGLLQTEMADKTVLLEKVIIRLINNGYLDGSKVSRIDFYLKSFLNNNDNLILSLEPLSYVVTDEKYILNERLNSFLKKLYMQLRTGKIITQDIIHKRNLIFEQDIFSLKSKRFNDIDTLTDFCIKKVKDGYEESQVKLFFYKYKSKFFSNITKIV